MKRSTFLFALLNITRACAAPADYDQLTSAIQLQGNEKVLDYGCRSGKVTFWFAYQLPQGKVLAVDHDQALLSFTQQEAKKQNLRNVVCLNNNPQTLSLYKNTFDYISSTAYLHWVGNYESHLNLMHQLLKPNGKIVLRIGVSDEVGRTVPFHTHINQIASRARWQPYFSQMPGQWYFPLDFESAQNLLEQAGFAINSIAYISNTATFASTDDLTNWILTWIPHAKYLSTDLAYSFASQIAERFDSVCMHDEQGNIVLELPCIEIIAQK